LGAIIFLLDLYLFFASLGYRKKNCRKCKGYLEDTTQLKNVYIGGKASRFYKRWLEYTYVYSVDGKQYRVSGGVPGVRNNVKNIVDIIYQTKNPKRAYIDRLTFPLLEPVFFFILLPLWIIFVICGINLI
jgi:hypothetical protein